MRERETHHRATIEKWKQYSSEGFDITSLMISTANGLFEITASGRAATVLEENPICASWRTIS